MSILKLSSSINLSIASANSSTLFLFTNRLLLLGDVASGNPPTLETITGVPHACASTAATPKLSLSNVEGNTATSNLLKASITFS